MILQYHEMAGMRYSQSLKILWIRIRIVGYGLGFSEIHPWHKAEKLNP